MKPNIKSIILCGGTGSRLWPLSRESFPKQFVPLINGKSLLELTIDRVKSFGSLVCIANQEHRFLVQAATQQSDNLNNNLATILLEPVGRNTAAAMAVAALMPMVAPDNLLLFLPSDHHIPDTQAFIETIQEGISAARNGYIVTFGIQPTFPSTAYGYIQQGSSISEVGSDLNQIYSVKRFIEKPAIEKAEEMLLSGNYLWNAGIFLCQADVLIQAFEKHALDILNSARLAMSLHSTDGVFLRPEAEAFTNCRSESIDYAVMEHFNKVAVVPFKGAWTDLGSWNAVATLSDADESANRISGQGMVVYAKNTYINAPHRPVVALGTNNLIIVDTPDAVLVASKDQVEKVKDVLVQLKQKDITQAVLHRRVDRPWGWYDSIDTGERFQVKRILVKPGASLSLQMHHHRAEHWIVVKGIAKVINGDKVFLLKENQSTYIPIGVKHRLENRGDSDLEMIEVQSGDYLGEDDIVRFEDTYGRK